MKGIPILILLAFFAGAVVGGGLCNIDEPAFESDCALPAVLQDQTRVEPLGEDSLETKETLPVIRAIEVTPQKSPRSSGKPRIGTRKVQLSDHSSTCQFPDRRNRRTPSLSELAGSSQQRVQFEAAQMLHPELEKLDPLDLYFDDVSWPY